MTLLVSSTNCPAQPRLAAIRLDVAPLAALDDLPHHLYPADIPLPLQQHPAYGLAAASLGGNPQRLLVHSGDELLASAVMMHRRFFGLINFTTLFRGPVWLEPAQADGEKVAILQAISQQYPKWRWRFLALQPEQADGPATRSMMTSAGLARVMGGFATAWLDLRPPAATLRANMNGKWRNQLVKAEKAKLTVSTGGSKARHYGWLLEKETAQRSNRGYSALPAEFITRYCTAMAGSGKPAALSISLLEGRDKIAGGLFLLHGNSATYQVGWTGQRGRQLCAQNLVIFEAVKALKALGISFLDMGGMNSDTMAGIARFKLGCGAAPHLLSGSWM